MNYILDGQTPIPCDDIWEFGRWFETADRHDAKTQVGPFNVSTVFLGIDHGLTLGDAAPVLFETMVFADGWDDLEWGFARYTTWQDAETGHATIIDECEERS